MTQNPTLTNQQQKFIENFVNTLDPEQSAKNAGYTKKDATRRGRELLSNPKILAAISEKIYSLAGQFLPPKAFFVQKLLEIISSTTAQEAVLDRSGNPTGKTKLVDAGAALRALDALNKLVLNNEETSTSIERSFTINNLNTDLI